MGLCEEGTLKLIESLKRRALRPGRMLGASGIAGRAAIIPPATPGSVGDAAMLSATIRALRARGYHTVDLLYGGKWPLDERIDNAIGAERFFYRGSRLQELSLLRRITSYQFVGLIGADVIDGAYNPGSVTRRLSLLKAASRHARATAVLGASYNEHPEPTTRRALAGLSSATGIYARDPLSHDRLERALARPVSQSADIAFLVEPLPDHAEAKRVRDWIAGMRAAGKQILALNANYLHAAKVPGFREALSTFIARAVAADLALVLVPHDSRTGENDRQVLARAVPAGADHHVTVVDTDSPGAIKAVLGSVDGLFTGPLHAMILAMGAGTPAIGLAYQGKFEGPMRLFGLEREGLLTTPDALAASPDDAFALGLDMLRRSPALKRRIGEALPEVTTLSNRNFSLA